MSELADLSQRITRMFDVLNLEVPSEDTNLFETGLLDSLTFVELLVQVEDQLGVTVSLEQLEPDNFRSIRQIAAFVLANQRFSKHAGSGQE
jgi:D-alanine--poly(phosphoribitol) ligase subunit 2